MLRARAAIVTCGVLTLLTSTCCTPPQAAPELLAPSADVAPHPIASASASAIGADTLPSQAKPPEIASPPVVASRCEPLTIDSYGVRQSSPRIYEAARRYFLAHTLPGSPHALGPELAKERPMLRFGNVYERETGDIMQATINEITTKYPDSVIVPTKQKLLSDACYDEVYLDLTEDGRYVVIVETATARPVFMYWTSYRP